MGVISFIAERLAPTRWKEFTERHYWSERKRVEGTLANAHYEYFYTRHFGLSAEFFENKTLLDIGCGPRGSLEWAPGTARTIGVDPLAEHYLKLGADQHRMEYLAANSELIPLPDGSCDAIFSFNSLDHVESVDQTISEIKRLAKPGGIFLLLVEINHEPTATEPHSVTPDGLLAALTPEFRCDSVRAFRPAPGKGIYDSISEGMLIDNPGTTHDVGYLSARFTRV